MITIENKKVFDFLKQKDDLVNEGRKISAKIEEIEKKTLILEKKEKAITGKVKVPKELSDRGEALVKEINEKTRELEKLGADIEKTKLDAIPADMKAEHLALLAEKEKLERDRNKVALKVQKIKDRVIPIIQKEVKPILRKEKKIEIDIGKYEDIETAKIKDGQVVIDTFNYLQDFRQKFNK